MNEGGERNASKKKKCERKGRKDGEVKAEKGRSVEADKSTALVWKRPPEADALVVSIYDSSEE